MPDFSPAVLNPISGELALNMKILCDDAGADQRRRQSNANDFDKAINAITISERENSQLIKHLAQMNWLTSSQTGETENQQTVSPVRTATGDAIVGSEGVSAAGVAVSAQAVATSLGNLASALVPIITAAGGVVSAQSLAALLPVVVNAVGGASTPSQTQAKPTS